MSWRMKIRHVTEYTYDQPVHASYNEARISPLETPHQFTLEHRVEVDPAANLFRYRDYWGTRVHVFDLHQEHTHLVVTGTSLVETAERTPSPDNSVGWDAIDAAGIDGPVLRIPDAHLHHRRRRRGDGARRRTARRPHPGPRARHARRAYPRRHPVPQRQHQRVDHRDRGARRPAKACVRTSRTSGSRCSGAPVSPRATRPGTSTPKVTLVSTRRTRARGTRGSKPGSVTGIRSTRPPVTPWRNAMCWWRGPRLHRRHSAQGRVPRRLEPRARGDRRAHPGGVSVTRARPRPSR